MNIRKRLVKYAQKHKWLSDWAEAMAVPVFIIGFPFAVVLPMIPFGMCMLLDWNTASVIIAIPSVMGVMVSMLGWCAWVMNTAEQVSDPFTEYVQLPISGGWGGDM